MSRRRELKLTFQLTTLVVVIANLLILSDRLFLSLIIPGQFYTALFIALILYITLYSKQAIAALLISLIGLSFDMQTAEVLGPGMFSSLSIYLIFSALAPSLYVSSNLVLIFIGSIAVAIFYMLNIMIQYLFGLPVVWQFNALIITAVVTGILTPLVFRFGNRYLAKS